MKTLNSILLGGAAGVAAFAAVAAASGAPAIEPPKDQTSVHEMKLAQLDMADGPHSRRLQMMASAHEDLPLPPHGGDGPPPGPHGWPQGPGGPRGPLAPANRLSAEETAIGIRGAQLDAWRDYTDALQAVLAPPAPPKHDGADAFAMPEALAADAEARGKAGVALKVAVATLRSQLTPDQLVRAAKVMIPPPPPGKAAHEFPAAPHDGGERAEPGPSSPR